MCNLFIGADLSILWSQPQTYRWYARGVRAEYAHVPNDQYRIGRAAVLDSLEPQAHRFAVMFQDNRDAVPSFMRLDNNINWEKKALIEGTLDV